jgi:hypothetical protein
MSSYRSPSVFDKFEGVVIPLRSEKYIQPLAKFSNRLQLTSNILSVDHYNNNIISTTSMLIGAGDFYFMNEI